MAVKAFEIGKTYWTNSMRSTRISFQMTIAKRTAKTITTTDGKTFRISILDGVEQVKMQAYKVFSANKESI